MDYFWLKTDKSFDRGLTVKAFTKEDLTGSNPIIKRIEVPEGIEEAIPQDYMAAYSVKGQYRFVSEKLKALISLYNPNKEWTPIVMLDQFSGQYLYWFLEPEQYDCLAESSRYRHDGTIDKPVINRNKLGNESIFCVETKLQKIVFVRLDLAESILRREFCGISLEKVRCEEVSV